MERVASLINNLKGKDLVGMYLEWKRFKIQVIGTTYFVCLLGHAAVDGQYYYGIHFARLLVSVPLSWA